MSQPMTRRQWLGGIGFPQLQDWERPGFEIVALCDVDEVYAKKTFDRWPEAKRFRDFREMYDTMDDRLDIGPRRCQI